MKRELPTGGDVTEQAKPITIAQPRARGEVRASFDGTGGTARLTGLRQAGSLRALFPGTAAKSLQMVLTNTSGGVTGGDRFRTRVSVARGAAVTVTTQAAERAYHALPGQTGRVDTTLTIGSGSRLHWLPQETILFDGCDFARRLSVDVAPGGSVLLVEPVVFGRSAMGESVQNGCFDDRIEIHADGRPIFLDRTKIEGDLAETLERPGVANGARAMALVVLVDPIAEVARDRVRDLLPDSAGASLLGPDVLVARILAGDAFLLRKTLLPLIEALHSDAIPRPWMI